MNRYPVKSDNIISIGYDEIGQMVEIEFKLNVIFQYLEVPLNEYVALMKAQSIDDFFFNFIQNNYHYNMF